MYALLSASVKGRTYIFCVTRLCKPPLFFRIFLVSHDVADPQTMKTRLFCVTAQLFQKCSIAEMRLLPRESSHGNSSIKTMCLPFAGRSSNRFCNLSEASSHVRGFVYFLPFPYRFRAIVKFANCSGLLFFASPVFCLIYNTKLARKSEFIKRENADFWAKSKKTSF